MQKKLNTLFNKIYKVIKYLIKVYYQIKWRFASLKIRLKLIIIIGLLFIGLFSSLSFIILQKGKQILNERLAQTCDLSLRHVSQVIKEDLLLYYDHEENESVNSEHLGHIREAIFNMANEKIEGLMYACVIDRKGNFIALVDSSRNRQNQKITARDSTLFWNLNSKLIREKDGIIEFIHPILAKANNKSPVYLGVAILGFSKSIIMQPINQATRTLLFLSFFVIIVSVFAISFVAQRMTRQIDALGRGVRKISDGDLDTDIPLLSNDELGQLAKEFNTMITHLREKLQMQKYISKLTIQMIRNGEMADLPPEGEKREVTILFTDVRNFTLLTERLGAEEIVKLINIYYDLQARIIDENNGFVDKFYGDQVMSIFIGKTQADDAIHAAVEIQKSIKLLNKKRASEGKVTLTVGCGANIGYAILGKMGSKSRLDYTVIGDVVNVASRLCSIAKPDQILTPEHMADRLNNDYPTVKLEPVMVKGKRDPVSIIEIGYEQVLIM
ncbi:HAMP domain-containing protein [candidate division KSB1 bacterium]|nr:HAMP domain-containing protein [candidate division KSB1 bacterium]